MPPCSTLTPEYESLLARKSEFDTLLEKNDPAADLTALLTLKAELIDRKRALEDQLNPLESVLHIKEQYEEEKKMIADYGILENNNGQEGITGINENGGETFYPYPTFAAIRSLIRENREMLKQKSEQGFVKMYLTPFAKKLDLLLDAKEAALQKHFDEGNLFRTKKDQDDPNEKLILITALNPMYRGDEYANADTSGDLVYHPKEFTKNHGGKTKQELIAASLDSKIPGYSLIFLEDSPNIPRGGKAKEIGGRKQLDTAGTSIKSSIKKGETIPSPDEYLTALQKDPQYQNESGLTPEEAIVLDLAFLHARNQVLDDYHGTGSVSYHLGAYFKSGCVPRSRWFAGGGRAYAGGNGPEYRGGDCGVRPAVRITQKPRTA